VIGSRDDPFFLRAIIARSSPACDRSDAYVTNHPTG